MIDVRTFTTAGAADGQLGAIHALLSDAFHGEFTDHDWQHTIGGTHVVVVDGGAVVSHVSVVERVIEIDGRPFHAGYVEGVATAPSRRRSGLGTLVMAEATSIVRAAFELGALSTGEHAFYEPHGWERWRGPTFVRRSTGLERTEDEDDGIMVLRVGPRVDVDLGASISCDERPGDDW